MITQIKKAIAFRFWEKLASNEMKKIGPDANYDWHVTAYRVFSHKAKQNKN